MTATTGETQRSVTPLAAPGRQNPTPVPIGEHDRRIRDVLPAVVRQVPIGVGILRRDRTIAYRNDELSRILRRREADGARAAALPPMLRSDGSHFQPAEEPLSRLVRTRQPIAREAVTLVCADGSRAAAAITMTPIIDQVGAVIGAVLYAEAATDESEDVSLREAFVGVLSHELRTPITSIYGGTQLLLNDRMSADVRSTVIHDIAAEAERLHRLVEDLLAIARVERGVARSAAEPVLLQRLAVQAARAEERRWPGRVVHVEAPLDLPAVSADDGHTLQALRNLISNAVKYSPADQAVVVHLQRREGEVQVAVLDRGPGFPAETGPDAFRLFHRSPDVAAHVSGTGIGLYVARSLIEAQGGRIWLRDRAAGGAEVGFALPIYAADDPD